MSNSKILAFTTSHGSRRFLKGLVPAMRAHAGCWFDWLICLGDPDPVLVEQGEALLRDPDGHGIQMLKVWPAENRGQHWSFKVALDLAREEGYEWIVRIDDDIQPHTKQWLRATGKDTRGNPKLGILDRLEFFQSVSADPEYRLIGGPRVLGLQQPLQPLATLEKGQKFRAEVVELLGGALRVHNVHYLRDFTPDLYAPVGRQDPQQLDVYNQKHLGMFVRFPDIRIWHATTENEKQDTPELAEQRALSHVWPWLETTEV